MDRYTNTVGGVGEQNRNRDGWTHIEGDRQKKREMGRDEGREQRREERRMKGERREMEREEKEE